MSFTVAHHRGEYIDLLSVVTLKYEIDYLVTCVFDHRFACHVADSCPRTGIQQTQEVVDLSDSAYCGSRIAVDSLLFYGYHRCKSGDLIDIRPLKVPEHIACVGGECLDVPPLSFGIDCVECE